MEFRHTSVLLDETIDQLQIKPDGIYADGTLGGGGHSEAILQRLGEKGRLIGFDQDADAIRAAGERLSPFGDRVTIIRSNYRNMRSELETIGIHQVDGIVLDLGVSSYQLDNFERGFSYRGDAPLDMRMDQRQERTAADVVNDYDEMSLVRILRDYGEERFAGRIARSIIQARQKAPILTTGQLTDIIRSAIPAKQRETGGHPAKRSFQAIRIEVNGELDVLRDSLDEMIDMLGDGGRICVITFHSLEDRIIKNVFQRRADPCTCPPGLPCVCGKKADIRKITRKPVEAGEAEREANPRARSAKLRVAEKIETGE